MKIRCSRDSVFLFDRCLAPGATGHPGRKKNDCLYVQSECRTEQKRNPALALTPYSFVGRSVSVRLEEWAAVQFAGSSSLEALRQARQGPRQSRSICQECRQSSSLHHRHHHP